MECNFRGICDPLGNAKDSLLSTLCLEKLVWKAIVNHMEYGLGMWLVWTERNTCIFEDNERPLDLLKALLFDTLFQWACVWGFYGLCFHFCILTLY